MKAIVSSDQIATSGGNARTDFLNPGQFLSPGDKLISPNGLFSLTFDGSDGELKLKDWTGAKYWNSSSVNKPHRATLTSQGHFEVTDKDNHIKWDTKDHGGGTFAAGQSGFITMQNNGNLVIYDDQTNSAIWQSNTVRSTPVLTRNVLYAGDILTPGDMLVSSNKMFRMIYEEYTGNLVIYDWNNQWIWDTQTSGTSRGRVIMQLDGNLCLYDGDKQFKWGWTTSAKALTAGSYAELLDNGVLTVYKPDKTTVLYRSGAAHNPPSNATPQSIQTTPQCGVVAMVNGGNAATSICGGVITAVSGCGAVMSGIGMCGSVYSGASFCGAVANAVGVCGADVATFGVCAAVAAVSGASVVSVTAVGACGAVATIAGVCGAVVAAAGASAIGASGAAACGAVACGAAACGADASGAGACLESSGAGACGANATGIQGAGVCGAQVGFCGAVLCVAVPIGGNW